MSEESEPEPISITAYPKGSEWWARVEDDRGGIIDDRAFSWDGSGRFYEEGLNALVWRIPKGYAYTEWHDSPDGSHTAVLKRLDPRFER